MSHTDCACAKSLYREFKRLSLRSGEVSLFLRQDVAESPCRRRYMGGLCTAEKIASKHGVSRASLYKWKDELLGREREPKMSEQFVIQSNGAEQSTENLRSEVARLEEKIAKLQQEAAKYEQEAFRARLQRDIYEKASELIKKEAGIDLDNLTNKEKAILINALRVWRFFWYDIPIITSHYF